ncbi:hypothetical protein ACMAZE_07510 [Pseudopelagicola sp. nBUS_20]|uniref:hypothetical protein n=1 Tax=Pseudopelagicola sp. nBUS_20 TaxID=3395317 RepID=UPI003EB96798
MVDPYFKFGWVDVPYDTLSHNWARQALSIGQQAMKDPLLAHWWVCENTWFVGVDALPNDVDGAMPGGVPFPESAKHAVTSRFRAMPRLHEGQLSVVRPGYPRPRAGESTAAFCYRQKRCAAHVDGLKPVGPEKRRYLEERHAWILGLPLTENDNTEAPLVVWEGSHLIIQKAFCDALHRFPTEEWQNIDLTDVYHAARRQAFQSCRRVAINARPGGGFLLHRLCLHGVAPWGNSASANPDTYRAIAYFRPKDTGPADVWLNRR